ncbi:hypothetical protein TNCV_705551 [Trichonephila clavipes]|nr:hypothetical protein TNCV_705551 [Trichonephila clavipes]
MRPGRASTVKAKVADVETVLQRSPMKRPSVYINIITEFIALLSSDERNNPYTLDELKRSILHAVSSINSHTLRKISSNLVKRVVLRKTDIILNIYYDFTMSDT